MPKRQDLVRAALRAMPDGGTVREIAENTCMEPAGVAQVLPFMPDVYIDRWQPVTKGKIAGNWAAVWCAVEVPEDCPKPEPRGRKAVAA